MKLKPLLLLAPLLSTSALAAPEIRPIANPVEQTALPSATESTVSLPSAIEGTRVINRPSQLDTLPSAAPAQPLVTEVTHGEANVATPTAPPRLENAAPAPLLPAKPQATTKPKTTPKQADRSAISPGSSAPQATTSARPSANANVRDASEAAMASKAIELYEAKDYKGAMVLLKQLQPFYIRTQDAGMISLVGFAAMEAGESQLALDSFRQAAEWTDDEEFWLVLVDAHLRLNQPEDAQKILDGLPKSKERDQRIDALLGTRAAKAFESGQYPLAEKMLLETKAPLGAGNLELLGWIQLRLGKLAEAAASFEASYRKKPSSGAAQGLAFSHQRLKSIDKLVALADELKGPLQALTSDPAVREQVTAGQWTRIAVNEKGILVVGGGGAYTPPSPGVTIAAGPTYRQRNGDTGQGRLEVFGASVQGEWVGAQDKVTVKVDQFAADNGETRQSSMNTLYALWRHQTEDALELSLGLGISPTGGELSAKPIGELGLARYEAEYGWNSKLFRQANMESILSMSGARQANASGQPVRWGQVLEDGITLGGYVTLPGELKDWKAEGSLTAARISGVGVADNSKLAFWGRVLRPIDGMEGWRVGADMYTSAFDKNLSYYAPGFGGYYSPQASVNIGPAVAIDQQYGALKLNVYAGLGWGYVQQAAADGNPLTGAEPGQYAASSSGGLSTHLDIDAKLPLDRNWTLGLNLAGQSSPDYEEWRAWLYASYYFGALSSAPPQRNTPDQAASKNEPTVTKP